ncbi:MAG TPA: hypothetical protein VLG68_11045, partial [Gammaproteobacteria bacterium]|nr:hypothetical protein [Gammaproteobacteria bacterium]
MRRQSGFVHSAVMDLVFLFVLILLLLGLWKLLSTVVESDFALGAFLLWLMGAALMYWFSREDVRVLRVPLGFLLFSAGAAVLAPLSWWSESKLAVIAAAAVLVNAAFVAGNRGSRKLRQRLGSGSEPPFYLDQSINLLDDLFRWLGVSILAWFAVGLLPLLLVFVVPIEWIPWAAMVWGFGATAYFFLAVRKSRVRFLRLPLGLWA